MAEPIKHKDYLIFSEASPRGELGWGAKVTVLDAKRTPAQTTWPPWFSSVSYSTEQEAREAGVKAAIEKIDTEFG